MDHLYKKGELYVKKNKYTLYAAAESRVHVFTMISQGGTELIKNPALLGLVGTLVSQKDCLDRFGVWIANPYFHLLMCGSSVAFNMRQFGAQDSLD